MELFYWGILLGLFIGVVIALILFELYRKFVLHEDNVSVILGILMVALSAIAVFLQVIG
jgi:hypothetical protein